MPQLSATTLKLFKECPRCFWLHINKKIERPRGPFPSLPSGIDRVLKVYFNGYRQSKTLPPLISGKIRGCLSSEPLNLGFNDAQAKARLWGKLDDCLVLPDNRLAPLDHKTRASAPDDISYTEMYYKFQMDIYTLLLEKNGFPTSRTAYVVYYYPCEGKLHEGFPFDVLVHKIETHPEEAYAVFAEGCRCLNGPLPEPSPGCEFCRWLELRWAHLGSAQKDGSATAQLWISPRPADSRLQQQKQRADKSIPEDLFAG